MFRTIYIIIKQLFCEHECKIIVIPIELNEKKNLPDKMGIKPNIFKKCKKCDLIMSI